MSTLRLPVHGDDCFGVGFHSSSIVLLETLLSCIMNFKLWFTIKLIMTRSTSVRIRHILDPKTLLKKNSLNHKYELETYLFRSTYFYHFHMT
jgi:hypothetical protein